MESAVATPYGRTTEPSYDAKGRQNVESMSDRKLLEELVTKLRLAEDIAVAMNESAKSNPMMRAMLPKF